MVFFLVNTQHRALHTLSARDTLVLFLVFVFRVFLSSIVLIFILIKIFIDVALIYNVVLVSEVQQNDSVICLYIYGLR